jgi:murein hydrolase activator
MTGSTIGENNRDLKRYNLNNPLRKISDKMLLFKTMRPFLFALMLLVAGCSTAVFAQKTRQQLEKEKRENLDRMNEVRGILKQTTAQKRASLGQLKAIGQQIKTQNKKIDLLNQDLKLMDTELKELESARFELDQDLAKLKKEYGSMIYQSSKKNNSLNQLSFLFAAPSFNQFWVRYKYLQQYTKERQRQVAQMKQVQDLMVDKSNRITGKRKDQQNVLVSRISESKNLEGLKTKQSEVVKELSGREAELSEELAAIRKANQQVENSLTNLIRREITERRERARAAAKEKAARDRAEREALAKAKAEREKERESEKASKKPDDEAVAKKEPEPEAKKEPVAEATPNADGLNEEEVALASSFAASKGKLLWPVRSGFVSDHFGVKKNEYLNVMENNNGIDIQTSAGEAVRAVYDGVVMQVQSYPMMNTVIFVQHGDFYTVYSKVKNVNVRPGQKIKARESLGIVATNKDGVSEVNFQIWKNINKVNPESWLRPR